MSQPFILPNIILEIDIALNDILLCVSKRFSLLRVMNVYLTPLQLQFTVDRLHTVTLSFFLGTTCNEVLPAIIKKRLLFLCSLNI